MNVRVTIFGANGKVGSLVVDTALEKGFQVVAFSHGKTAFKANRNLRIVQGNIYNIQDVEKAIEGSDVVISALGSWGTPNKDILTEGMKNIIPTMQKYKLKRIISLTGADAYADGDITNPFQKLTHWLIGLFAKKILQDGERHIQLLIKSGLDWTVLRSPVMNEKGDPKHIAVTHNRSMPWSTINRSSVARCLVEQISDHEYIKSSPFIKRTNS